MIVVCSIHQPRSNIFSEFHKVLLLNKGKTVYYGGRSSIVKYFGSLGERFFLFLRIMELSGVPPVCVCVFFFCDNCIVATTFVLDPTAVFHTVFVAQFVVRIEHLKPYHNTALEINFATAPPLISISDNTLP